MPTSTYKTETGANGATQFVKRLALLTEAERTRVRALAQHERGNDVDLYDRFNLLYRPVRRKNSRLPQHASFTVYRLYPWNPISDGRGSFGASLGILRARLVSRAGKRQGAASVHDSLLRDFPRLLQEPEPVLFPRLLAFVRLLGRGPTRTRAPDSEDRGIPIDWAQLLTDLARWSDAGARIQHQWHEDFFKTTNEGNDQ